MADAETIREKLEQLRLLNPPLARGIESAWPKTLEYLDADDDYKPLGVATMAVNRRLLDLELDDAIRTATAL